MCLPTARAPVPSFSHSAVASFRRPPIPPFPRSAVSSLSRWAVGPFSHSPILPFCILVLAISSHAWAAETAPGEAARTAFTQSEQRQIEQYLALAMANPRSEHAFAKLYAIYKKHKEEYGLLNVLRSAIEADRKNKNLHILLGQVYLEFRDYYMAEKKLRDAIRLAPQDYHPRYLLAEVLVRMGEHAKAVEQYQQSIALTSDVGDLVRSYENLGRLHAAQKRRDQAIEAWDKALEFRKYDPVVRKHVIFKEARIK